MKMDFKIFPTLTTEHLTLRRLKLTDADELVILRSDELVNKYLGRPATCTKDDAEAFVGKIDKVVEAVQGFYWVICLKDTSKLVGTICYWNIVPEKNMADIGYELSPAHQRQGLMQEALKEVVRLGFSEIGFQTIVALTHPDNRPSAKLLERSGFTLDQTFSYLSKENAEGQAAYVLTKADM